jgi:hypothetical protein
MHTTVKVAVSLPKEQFRLAEKQRRALHVSRSAMVQEALAQWLKTLEEEEAVRRYIEGYQRHPESTKGWKAIERMQTKAIAKELGHETW